MRRILLLISAMVIVGAAGAEPVEWPVSEGGNGHFYEMFGGRDTPYDGVTWTEAEQLALAMSHQGMNGHLVTVTSPGEEIFVSSLPGVSCDLVGGDPPCIPLHVGGWSVVTEVIDPQPYNPPYVETTDEQWITGETGEVVVWPNAFVTGPVGEILYFKWGVFSLDGMGYPSVGLHAVTGPSTALGMIVEYDGLTVFHYPDASISTTKMSWGQIKTLYR